MATPPMPLSHISSAHRRPEETDHRSPGADPILAEDLQSRARRRKPETLAHYLERNADLIWALRDDELGWDEITDGVRKRLNRNYSVSSVQSGLSKVARRRDLAPPKTVKSPKKLERASSAGNLPPKSDQKPQADPCTGPRQGRAPAHSEDLSNPSELASEADTRGIGRGTLPAKVARLP
jgi:hypothetical protein